MLNQVKVGVQSVADGTDAYMRGGRGGETIVSNLNPRYYEMASRGNVYSASNTAAQAVSVALTTTYTGLCISNPIGSGFNLAIIGAQYALSVAPAAIASLHLIAGYSATSNVTHTAALASPGIQSLKIGANNDSIAKADTQATIVNPTYLLSMGSGFTAAALYATTPSWNDLGGAIVVTPGGWIAWGALTAVTGFGSFAWMELPA